jgi:oligopeptide/dipeptide ABC transporter ATP-binding protein
MSQAPALRIETPALRIENLEVHFHTDAGLVRAVDGVSFDVGRGRTLALVGESGCGKSVTALSILRLVPIPPGEIAAGRILLGGEDLVHVDDARMRGVRGNEVAMIFQEPMTSLNPVYTVGDQISESLALHRGLSGPALRRETVTMIERVGIPSPERRADEFPHQMSGGMRQRVMIAMALACEPELLIADEPTTALDVTIQAQILELLRKLQAERQMSILLITHDLGVVAELAHEVVVMYAGRVVERAPVKTLFAGPRHPYTAGLFHSIPSLERDDETLHPIEGNVPDALEFPEGCRFHPRCPLAEARCAREEPPITSRGPGHAAACWVSEARPDLDLLS